MVKMSDLVNRAILGPAAVSAAVADKRAHAAYCPRCGAGVIVEGARRAAEAIRAHYANHPACSAPPAFHRRVAQGGPAVIAPGAAAPRMSRRHPREVSHRG